MMMRIRVRVFVVLSDIFELFGTEGTVKCREGCREFGLEGLLASYRVLFIHEPAEFREKVYVCRAYFASSALVLGFFMLALGIESASLRDGRFDHPYILVDLPKTRQISFDLKRNRIHATYTNSYLAYATEHRQ